MLLNKESNDRPSEHSTASLGNIKRGNYVTGILQGNFSPCNQLSEEEKINGGKGEQVEQKEVAIVSSDTGAA